jgi:Ala-tRNA(Pro) deacylase
MAIAHTVRNFLSQNHIAFELVPHRHTGSSLRSASEAHVRPARLAKAVLLEDDFEHDHFLMAVVPATRRVEIDKLARRAGRPLHLATEEAAAGLFADCEAGAIPALGTAYGVETMLDESLDDEPVLYFEAGDHEHLVRVDSGAFFRLLGDCARGQFSSPS